MKYCPKCNQPGDGAFCIHCGTQLFTTQDNLGMSSGTVLEGTLYTYQLQKVLGQGGFGNYIPGVEPGAGRAGGGEGVLPRAQRCSCPGRYGAGQAGV